MLINCLTLISKKSTLALCCQSKLTKKVSETRKRQLTNFTEDTVFPRIIAGDDYFYFRTKRGRLFEGRRLFEGGDYLKYFSQEVVKK